MQKTLIFKKKKSVTFATYTIYETPLTDLLLKKFKAVSMLPLCWNKPWPFSRLYTWSKHCVLSVTAYSTLIKFGKQTSHDHAHHRLSTHHLQQVQQSSAISKIWKQILDGARRTPLKCTLQPWVLTLQY